jgi:hypothetical protein
VSHEFLSEEWIEAARAIRAKYADVAARVDVSLRINQVVTGVPFGEGTVTTHMDTTSGEVQMEMGPLEAPDATVTMDYDTARAILVEQDQAATMAAFMGGKIKVEGDLMKIMSMQTALPQDDVARTIAEEIRAITR